jgi:hypothetical protein
VGVAALLDVEGEALTQAYRHRNGGGTKVYPAQASPDSFIDKVSSVEGESGVYVSSLTAAALKDSFVAWSLLTEVTAADCRLSDSFIEKSDIVGSEVVTADIAGCRLFQCRVSAEGGPRPRLRGVTLTGVTVYGDVALSGPWGLDLPGAHIHAGEWREAPRHTLIEGEGVHVAVVECTDGRAHMGCTCKPISYWLEKGPRLARRLGWNEEQIETCLNFLKSL